tara:strand:- start:349 stop:666 length:318 start_codon:yes stop_codon:yes gene_type:complete
MSQKRFNLKDTKGMEFNTKETYDLLKMNRQYLMCWAARDFVNMLDKALRFKVSGYLHKGLVYVTLNGGDLYDVHLVSTHGNLKETKTDIYFDDLSEMIDKMVETK